MGSRNGPKSGRSRIVGGAVVSLVAGWIVTIGSAWFLVWMVDATPLRVDVDQQRGATQREQPRWNIDVIETLGSTLVTANSLRQIPPPMISPNSPIEHISRALRLRGDYEEALREDRPTVSFYEPADVVVPAPGWSRASRPPTELDVRFREEARGWPLRSLKYIAEGDTIRWGVDLGSEQGPLGLPRVLPLLPIWPGMIVNTMLWASSFFILIIGFGVSRRQWRTRHGRCWRCNYQLQGLMRCPECGTQH